MASSSRSKAVTWGECTAYDTDLEVECDCEEYRQFKNTTLCAECLHEQKKHLAGKASDRSTKDVTSILAGMAKGSSGSIASSTLSQISKARASLGSSGSRRGKAANEESNRGMRATAAAGKSKGKAKVSHPKPRIDIKLNATHKAVAKQNSSNMFRVSSIMVLPCGTRIVVSPVYFCCSCPEFPLERGRRRT
jgi:hypothetical protein